jgi:hypothetical protein
VINIILETTHENVRLMRSIEQLKKPDVRHEEEEV